MSKVVVVGNITLDGVTQAPGRPDEDRRGGSEHGGWATPYSDDAMGRVLGQSMIHPLVLGEDDDIVAGLNLYSTQMEASTTTRRPSGRCWRRTARWPSRRPWPANAPLSRNGPWPPTATSASRWTC
jgi:hypothetical protein